MIRNAKIVGKLVRVAKNGYQGQVDYVDETQFYCETCNHQFPSWLKGDKMMLAKLEHRLDHLEDNIPARFMEQPNGTVQAD